MSKHQLRTALEKYKVISLYLEQGISLSKIAKEHQLHPKTLRRWIDKYQADGFKGLERKSRKDKGKRQLINEKLEQVIEALILRKPPISLAAVLRQAVKIAREENLREPTYRVVRDIAQKLNPALVLLAHEGTKEYAQIYELLYRQEASAPNEVWQADHTPLDIALLDERGNSKKPWLTAIEDDYSRAICGYFLSFESPCALHTALALRQAIWRKSDSKWIVSGIPEVLYTDHGSDFTSMHIERVCADLKTQLIFSTVGKPRGRGKVERFFLSLNQLLLMDLPGYAPPKTPLPKASLTLEEFLPLLETFIIETYHHRKHTTTGHKPIKRWEGSGFLPQMPTSIEELDLLLLTVPKSRKVRRDGIYFHNFRYIDTLLADYVGESVTIRYDPRDLAQVSIFFQEQFLCHATSEELSGHSISLKEIIKARRRRKKQLKKVIHQRQNLLSEILANKQEQPTNNSTPSSLKRYENQ